MHKRQDTGQWTSIQVTEYLYFNYFRDGLFPNLETDPLSTNSPIINRKDGAKIQKLSGSNRTQAVSGSISQRSPIVSGSIVPEILARNSKSGTLNSESSVSADSLGSSVSHRKSFSGTNMHSSLGYLP